MFRSMLRPPLSAVAACLALATCGGDDGDGGGSATIEGTVLVQGAPAQAVRVAVDAVDEGDDGGSSTSVEDLEPTEETETDDAGSYSITGLEPGSYTLFTDVEGCRILATVEVESDETVTADLEVPANYTPTGPLSLLPDGNILAC
jgi:hypothetical protein